jgi:hypothetical protein
LLAECVAGLIVTALLIATTEVDAVLVVVPANEIKVLASKVPPPKDNRVAVISPAALADGAVKEPTRRYVDALISPVF